MTWDLSTHSNDYAYYCGMGCDIIQGGRYVPIMSQGSFLPPPSGRCIYLYMQVCIHACIYACMYTHTPSSWQFMYFIIRIMEIADSSEMSVHMYPNLEPHNPENIGDLHTCCGYSQKMVCGHWILKQYRIQ
jgi:hypothetical protein